MLINCRLGNGIVLTAKNKKDMRNTCWSIIYVTSHTTPPKPITLWSFWASTEWLTCPESFLHVIYGSGVLPLKKRGILLDQASHTDPVLTQLDSPKNTDTLTLTRHWLVTNVVRKIGQFTFIICKTLGQTHPHCAHCLLFVFQLPHIKVMKSGIPVLIHMQAFLFVCMCADCATILIKWAEMKNF